MDAAKLKNVLKDLVLGMNGDAEDKLNSLPALLEGNAPDLASYIADINSYFSGHTVNNYSSSDAEIVRKIGADDFFGTSGMFEIDSILDNNSYNIRQSVTELQDYIRRRTEFIRVLRLANDNLTMLNIEEHYPDSFFEVGILLPKQVTGNRIKKITKELDEWDKIFKTLKELCGEPVNDTEIDFISNGSHQFFIDNPVTVTTCLSIIIDRIIKVYKSITEIRKAKATLKNFGISKEEQPDDDQEKIYRTSSFESIANDIVKDFAQKELDSGRINEISIAMNGHVSHIAKCIGTGIIIEINPPKLSPPPAPLESDNEEAAAQKKVAIKDYEKKLKEIEAIQKSMQAVKEIASLGNAVIKLLHDSDEPDEEEKDSE